MKSGNWSCVSRPFPPQIISQKDEHCWVGELNGLRGEASVRSCVALGKGKAGLAGKLQRGTGFAQTAASVAPVCPQPHCEEHQDTRPPAPHGPCFSHRLVSSKVRGSPG